LIYFLIEISTRFRQNWDLNKTRNDINISYTSHFQIHHWIYGTYKFNGGFKTLFYVDVGMYHITHSIYRLDWDIHLSFQGVSWKAKHWSDEGHAAVSFWVRQRPRKLSSFSRLNSKLHTFKFRQNVLVISYHTHHTYWMSRI
jgi:hypothetical protein